MPLINGKYIEFDALELAKAIAEGKKIEPDVFDFEKLKDKEERIKTEVIQIDNALREHFPKVWFEINFPMLQKKRIRLPDKLIPEEYKHLQEPLTKIAKNLTDPEIFYDES